MRVRGRYLLLGVGILLIIFGLFSMLEVLVLMNAILSSNAWTIFIGISLLALYAVELAAGVLGAAKSGNPAEANFFIASGVALLALSGLSTLRNALEGGFQISQLIGMVLPALFILGGLLRRRSGQERKISVVRRVLSIAAIAAVSAFAAYIAGMPFVNHTLTITSLKKLDAYPLYSMTYYGDYNLNYEVENPDITGHCTCFLAFNERGEPIYGRNFDDAWQSHPMTMLTTHAPGKLATLAMCDIFYMGYNPARLPTGSIFSDQALLSSPRVPADGMNEYGVAISFLGVPYHPRDSQADPGKKSVDQTGMMRLVLDHARNVDEAVELIRSYNVVLEGAHVPGPDEPSDHDGLDSTHFLLADASGNSVIVEFIGGQIVVKKAERWQTVTNFIVSGKEGEGVGQDRYQNAEDELRAKNGVLSEDEAMALLRKVSQAGTHWSAVYNLKTGEVRLAMARNYDEIYSFKLEMHR